MPEESNRYNGPKLTEEEIEDLIAMARALTAGGKLPGSDVEFLKLWRAYLGEVDAPSVERWLAALGLE